MKTKEVELHGEDHPRKRITIISGCAMIIVPVLTDDGFGKISYIATGILTDDGVEIWEPYKHAAQ